MAIKIRILTIDIMRGLTLFMMLFVNDLFTPGVPKWMVHALINEDRLGLADWVFPGFLFMVGLSIPFAYMARKKLGKSHFQMLKHIFIRTISLLIIGVFMVNIARYNADISGINKFLWAILVYISVFLIWNDYPKGNKYKMLFKALIAIGISGLLILAAFFRSGTAENVSWLSTSWWGILGLIGWGYLVAALTYLYLKDNIKAIAIIWVVFIILNILSQTPCMDFMNPVRPIFGVILDGNIPSFVLSGLLIGVLLKKYQSNYKQLFPYLISIGFAALIIGFILKNWFIISKLSGTPTWLMLCTGISILLFTIIYYIIDIKKWILWGKPFLIAGQNSLTTYLAPDILYYTIWGLNLNILFYKQSEITWLAVFGSIIWAFTMIGLAVFLSKLKIRLKL